MEEDGTGVGVGVFQLTVAPGSGVSYGEASNLYTSAYIAASVLASNYSSLQLQFPNFTPAQLLQATTASYNFGTGNISGNPATIDVGSAGGNYGSNVVAIMQQCFH